MKPIVTLTLNPTIDAAAKAETVRPTRGIRTFDERYDPGGGGINVARVINELGGRSLAVYLAGGLTGGVRHHGEQGGRRHWTVPIAGLTRVSHVVHELSTGREFRFTPKVRKSRRRNGEPALNSLPCWTSTISLRAAVCRAACRRISINRCRDRDSETSEVRPRYFRSALKAALDWHPSRQTQPRRTRRHDRPGSEGSDVLVSAAQELVASGAVEHLAITMGHEGALLVSAAAVKHLRAPEVEVRSAVGAGDSFVGAMTLGLALGRPLNEAFALGVAAGTATVTTIGTELCRREDVEALDQTLIQE